MHPLTKLFNHSKKYRADIIIATIYSVLNKIFDILPEVMIGLAVNIIVKRQDSILAHLGITNVIHQIVVLGIMTGATWVLESAFQYLYGVKWCVLAQNIQHDLRIEAYDHVQNLDLAYFEDKTTGNLMSILNDDINQLELFLNDGLNQIIQIFASTILISIVFFCISVKITLLSFIPIPLIVIISFYFRKKIAPLYLNVRNQAGLVNNKLNYNISGISTIKSFVAEQYEISALTQISNKYKNANKRAILFSSAITPTIRMGVMLGFLVCLIYGGFLTIEGHIDVASYSILIFLSQRLLWPLTYLAAVIDNYQRSMASVNRVMDLLNTKISIKGGKQKFANKAKGEISFENISFGYPGRRNMFTSFNLNIESGKTVAFVGRTGSGKSTIIKLLLRFYDLTSGQIFIDGIDIKNLTLKSLRNQIGMVSQETFLIDGSVADNISYGSFSANRAEIIKAAQVAEADNFIRNLPHGYDTLVGERGQKLSGGQRQRIAIARAILKNPPILILDEATSALDNKTEDAVQQALDTISKNRTTIIIAHRLSTVVKADNIIVLQRGKIVESGNHSQLLKVGGVYSELWNLQMREKSIS